MFVDKKYTYRWKKKIQSINQIFFRITPSNKYNTHTYKCEHFRKLLFYVIYLFVFLCLANIYIKGAYDFIFGIAG